MNEKEELRMSSPVAISLIESLIRPYSGIPDHAIGKMAETETEVTGYMRLKPNHALAIQSARAHLRANRAEMSQEQIYTPKWSEAGKVHDWRNHVPDEIQEMWQTFSCEQRRALASWAGDLASAEEWE